MYKLWESVLDVMIMCRYEWLWMTVHIHIFIADTFVGVFASLPPTPIPLAPQGDDNDGNSWQLCGRVGGCHEWHCWSELEQISLFGGLWVMIACKRPCISMSRMGSSCSMWSILVVICIMLYDIAVFHVGPKKHPVERPKWEGSTDPHPPALYGYNHRDRGLQN